MNYQDQPVYQQALQVLATDPSSMAQVQVGNAVASIQAGEPWWFDPGTGLVRDGTLSERLIQAGYQPAANLPGAAAATVTTQTVSAPAPSLPPLVATVTPTGGVVVTHAPAVAAQDTSISPILLIGLGVAAYFLFFSGKD